MGLKATLSKDYKRYTRKSPSSFGLVRMFFSKAGFRAVVLYRVGRILKQRRMSFLAGMCQRIMHHACHCYISVTAEIGPGFLIAHVGGIIIGGKTIIGENCDIRQNVTFGGNFSKKSEDGRSQPKLENGISVGAGACILGPVHIGDNAIIGANSVVTRDVPANMIASGVPAKVIKERWDVNESGRKL